MGALLLLVLLAEPDPKPVVAAHQTCQREKRTDKCPEALEGYVSYLRQAPGDSNMRFYYAELLWAAKRYAEAAPHYRQVALDGSSKYAEPAAYNQVLAREKLIGPLPRHRFDGKPWPLDVARQRLADAIDFYLEHHPDKRDAGPVCAVGAQLYFDVHDFVQAEHRALWLLARGLKLKFARDLLERCAIESKKPPRLGAQEMIGRSEAIGSSESIGAEPEEEPPPPEPIGKSEAIGSSEPIGEPQTIGPEPEENEAGEEVE